MFKKILAWILLPVLAIGGPTAWFSGKDWFADAIRRFTQAPPAAAAPVTPIEIPGPPGFPGVVLPGPPAPRPGAGPAGPASPATPRTPTPSLAEVLRFDVSVGWILAKWPRVSAGLSQMDLQGYRVPWVSGTAQDDVAGALTYYVNPRQEVQRITFQGTTGDARKLLQLLVTQYHFARRLTNDPQIFRYEVAEPAGPPESFLDLRLAKVIKTEDAYHRFEISLVIERPHG
jgi:hypothetical protein